MGKPTMVTRAMLIAFCVYGIMQFCMLFRPWVVEAYHASRAALGKDHEAFAENSRVYDVLFDIIRESGDGDFWEKFSEALGKEAAQ